MAIQQTLRFGVVLAIAVQLTIAAAPAGEESPADDLFVARGHSARLDCDPEAFWQRASLPAPQAPAADRVEARWFFEATPLSKEDGRWKLYRNGTLVVPKAGKRPGGGGDAAEGVYRCLVVHPRYGAALVRTINLRIAYMKEFLRQPDDAEAREGQPIVLPCSVDSLPKAAVQWERDGVPLPPSKRYVPLPSGSLLVTSAHSSDEGSYRCKVANAILKKSKKSKAGKLVVRSAQAAASSEAMVPLDAPSNVTAVVGDDVALYCLANGTRQPGARWLDADDVVVSNASVLVLRNVTRRQGGAYFCSTAGGLRRAHFVDVQQAPAFNSTPSAGAHVLAKNIRLNCTASGWPAPRVRWFKDGRPFDPQAHVRAQQFDWGLLIRSPTVSDGGVYQCLASNRAGHAWTGAAVRLGSSRAGPRSPWDIECLPYEADSVCLRWKAEPNVVAHTIIAHRKGSRFEKETQRDYLFENERRKLVERLSANAPYVFLIRTYNNQASDEFANVTCDTGVRGARNLTVLPARRPDAAALSWAFVSSDFNPCNETRSRYRVQWRALSSDGVNSIDVAGFAANITGLVPGERYEFRVQSVNSSRPGDAIVRAMPAANARDLDDRRNRLDGFDNRTTSGAPTPPLQLYASVLTASSINVSWTDANPPRTAYTLCYVPRDARKACEQGKLVGGLDADAKSALLERLKPRTEYEVRVRAHLGEGSSAFSHALLVSTPPDVPSEVQGLEYKVLTRTSACVKWEPPSRSNGRITKYSVRHSANLNVPTEEWTASSIFMPSKGCWDYDEDEIVVSTVLHDLDPDLTYFVNVVAVNDAGSGGARETLTISTKFPFHGGAEPQDEGQNARTDQTDVYYKQGVGVAIGIGIAFAGIFACFGVFVLLKYLKKKLKGRRRFASNGTAPNRGKQNGQLCHNAHELQQLVERNGNGHIAMLPTTILDTKGGAEYPNRIYGQNGHATNLRITENHQYYKKKKDEREYEEDSNSNLQKVLRPNGDGRAANGVDLNATQTTVLLDDSLSPSSSPQQPTLQPNG